MKDKRICKVVANKFISGRLSTEKGRTAQAIQLSKGNSEYHEWYIVRKLLFGVKICHSTFARPVFNASGMGVRKRKHRYYEVRQDANRERVFPGHFKTRAEAVQYITDRCGGQVYFNHAELSKELMLLYKERKPFLVEFQKLLKDSDISEATEIVFNHYQKPYRKFSSVLKEKYAQIQDDIDDGEGITYADWLRMLGGVAA